MKKTITVGLAFWLLLLLMSCRPSASKEEAKESLSGVKVKYARNFSIEYHPGYRLVKVFAQWSKNKDQPVFTYVLVDKGNKVPEGFAKEQIINTPVKSIISFSSIYNYHLFELGLCNRLSGITLPDYISNDSIRDLVKQGKVLDVGTGNGINIERIISLQPELIITYGMGNPQVDTYGKLISSGFKVAVATDHLENTPLARAEWLKFTAVFFNKERLADSLFNVIEKEYTTLKGVSDRTKSKPTVFTGIKYGDSWHMPGGKSFFASLLKDAGADYIWKDDSSAGSIPLSFEQVILKASKGDIWINTGEWKSKKDALNEDSRYDKFLAFRNSNIFNNNKRTIPSGGNDYWESGLQHPERILKDLISIFHPEVFPGYSLFYYKKLPESPEIQASQP